MIQRFFYRLFRSIGWVGFALLGVLLVAYYLLQLPAVQTRMAQQAAAWLSEKLGGQVSIGKVRINWFDNATFENVVVRDLRGREMIAIGEAYIDYKTNLKLNPEKLISFDQNLDYVWLKEPRFTLTVEKDRRYNFEHWLARIDSLTGYDPTKPERNTPFTIDEADVQRGQFRIIDPYEKRFPKNEFDLYNFTLSDVHGKVKNFFIQGDTIKLDAHRIKTVDARSNLRVHTLTTNFFYTKEQMLFKNLYAEVNNSIVRNFLGFYYQKPGDFVHFFSKVRIKTNLRDSFLDAQDLGRFVADMYAYRERYHISTDFDGTVDNFVLTNTHLRFGQQSYIRGRLAFKGMPDWRTATMQFDLQPSFITAADARQYGGESNYNTYVKPFEQVNFKGTFAGTFFNFTANGEVASTGLGRASGLVRMAFHELPAQTAYFADLVADNIQLGKLSGRPELLNTLAFTGKIDGRGTTLETADMRLNGVVRKLDFNGYNYQNVRIDGRLQGSVYQGEIVSADPNLQGRVNGTVDFNPTQNKFDITGAIQQANLKRLGFYPNEFILSTLFDLDFEGNKFDEFVGTAHFQQTTIGNGRKVFPIGRLDINSSQIADNQRVLTVDSDILMASASGNFVPTTTLTDIGRIVKEYLLFFNSTEATRRQYYATQAATPGSPYQLRYWLRFKKAEPLFQYFAPAISVAEGTLFSGDFRVADTAFFTLTAASDSVRVGNTRWYKNKLKYESTKSISNPLVTGDLAWTSTHQKIGGILAENAFVNATWREQNYIGFNSFIQQKGTFNKMAVDGQLSLLPDGFDIVLDSQKTTFDVLGEQWRLTPGNRIFVGQSGISVEDLEVSHEGKRLLLEGKISENPTDETSLLIDNFNLKSLNPLLEYQLAGIANGKISLADPYHKPLITSDVKIKQLTVEEKLVGDISGLLAWNNTEKRLGILASIWRDNHEAAKITGNYDPANELNPLKADVQLDALRLSAFEGFVEEIFSDLGGEASGNLTVEGKLYKPRLRGKIAVEGGQLRLNVLNSYFYFDDDIFCTEKGFVAGSDGIKLRDARVGGRTALLQGGVFYDPTLDYRLDLTATVQDREGFLAMNTTIRDSDYFYGKAWVGGNVSITGSLSDVLVRGNLTSRRGTKLTIPLDRATSVDDTKDAVPFLNTKREVVLETANPADSAAAVAESLNLSGLRMEFNLTITPDAECEIIFDRANNDRLTARGNGRLTIDYDTRGGLVLRGPFEVESGKYDFSFQNVSSLRKFTIQQGSRITWDGDPYEATMDMKAVYTNNISLKEILGTAASTEEQAIRYPVDVIVKLTNRLMQPTVTFDLLFKQDQLPKPWLSTILAFEQRLRNDEQLLNRNVTSVLLFNQLFPTETINANLTQQFLVDNISNIITNQLGNIFNQLDPNLELGVRLGDFRQNFSNVQVNVAYQYSDRLRFKGNSFYANPLGVAATSINYQPQLTVGGELEYLLTPDGTWRVRVFSRSVPNSTYLFPTSAGNVTVYGMNFQFTRNFNTLFAKSSGRLVGIGLDSLRNY